MSDEDSFRLMRLTLSNEILNKIASHLFKSRQEVFNPIQSEKVLLVLFLVQVPSQEVSHTTFHNSFFDFWEVIAIKFKIFDQLSGLFTVDISTKGLNELPLESIIVLNK